MAKRQWMNNQRDVRALGVCFSTFGFLQRLSHWSNRPPSIRCIFNEETFKNSQLSTGDTPPLPTPVNETLNLWSINTWGAHKCLLMFNTFSSCLQFAGTFRYFLSESCTRSLLKCLAHHLLLRGVRPFPLFSLWSVGRFLMCLSPLVLYFTHTLWCTLQE